MCSLLLVPTPNKDSHNSKKEKFAFELHPALVETARTPCNESVWTRTGSTRAAITRRSRPKPDKPEGSHQDHKRLLDSLTRQLLNSLSRRIRLKQFWKKGNFEVAPGVWKQGFGQFWSEGVEQGVFSLLALEQGCGYIFSERTWIASCCFFAQQP